MQYKIESSAPQEYNMDNFEFADLLNVPLDTPYEQFRVAHLSNVGGETVCYSVTRTSEVLRTEVRNITYTVRVGDSITSTCAGHPAPEERQHQHCTILLSSYIASVPLHETERASQVLDGRTITVYMMYVC